ncbi:MAG: hypothetical protein JW959_01015, partial [Pirellulales bacterium]|nr:hypothetical protein [Pirellulales bacterium]
RRLKQFPPDWAVYLTRAAKFEEKTRLFNGATFVVGADTLRRIASPQYHGGDAAALRRSLERMAVAGCRFLVFCRGAEGSRPERLEDLRLPETLRSICEEVPPEVFCEDISSTELRRR